MENKQRRQHRRGGSDDNKDRKKCRQRSRSSSASRDDEGGRRHKKSRHDDHHSSKPKQHSRKYKDRHDHDEYDDDSSSELSTDSSGSDDRKRHSKKRHHKDKKKKNKKKKHKKKKNKHRKRSRNESPPPAMEVSSAPAAPPGAHELASALTQLFHAYPAMSSLDEGGIPLLFIQLSRGTEYNLSSMPDRSLAGLLGVVFDALKIHGMEMGGSGAWKWANAPKGGGDSNDLALLRLVRALLNGVGVTLNSVEQYEHDQIQQIKQQKEHEGYEMQINQSVQKEEENEKDVRHRKRVERMTSQMLDRFDPNNSSISESSLANELQGICDVVMEGESIQLDGIENVKLRATLAQLFQLIGLEEIEMDDEEDGDEINDEDPDKRDTNKIEKAMGYTLPERIGTCDVVTSNLNEVLRVCRFRSSGGSEGAPTSWAANPALAKNNIQADREDSSSDDEDGPAPLGTIAAVKAAKRKRPSQQSNKAADGKEGGREEWMTTPGEHDFLKGISKSTRSRGFKNEKMYGQSIDSAAASAEPINPQVMAEVNAIQKAYEESRGPSLVDAHRQKLQELKEQQKDKKQDFKWSRDKNLDDGRRVDKNNLHNLLGGAQTELKSKFQGAN